MSLLGKAAVLLALVPILPAVSRAGFVTVQSVTGPGGAAPFKDATGATATVDLNYTSVNFIDVTLSVDSAGSYELYEGGAAISVQNSTGTSWAGFTFALISGPAGTQFTGADPDANQKFLATVVTPGLVTYSGGALGSVDHFAPAVDFRATAAGTVTIRETPLTAVPEPSSLAHLAVAGVLAGLAYVRRRRAVAPE